MKKITVLMLALALAVPAQAWHLFPVREKIVKETNWAVSTICAITGVVVGAIALVTVLKIKYHPEAVCPCLFQDEDPMSIKSIRDSLDKYGLKVLYFQPTHKIFLMLGDAIEVDPQRMKDFIQKEKQNKKGLYFTVPK